MKKIFFESLDIFSNSEVVTGCALFLFNVVFVEECVIKEKIVYNDFKRKTKINSHVYEVEINDKICSYSRINNNHNYNGLYIENVTKNI